ncbi:hypothetical protein SEUCBS140593_006976 [Sporothrix eucalyptigena]|uniref:Fibroin-3 related protein n=1 Tax=Sporothrix eucalyptigena TaxID=1812306 RepID=A0ABP0C997_9PEZI
MPSIDVAMVRSVATRRSVLDVLASAMGPVLYGRDVSDVEGKITDVKTAFSSWDNCMQADFCKGKKNKYLDEPYIPPNQGYRSEAPMATGLPYKPPVQDGPQYANFDVSKTAGHEDALPAMPSWESSNSKKVYLEEEVEMDNLKKPESTGPTAPLLSTNNLGNSTPGHNTPSPINSPGPNGLNGPNGSNGYNSPYGPSRSPTGNNMGPGGHPAVSNGYLAAGAIPTMSGAGASGNDPYSRGGPGYNSPQQSGVMDYGAELGGDETYGSYGAGAMGPGRQSPRQYNNQRPGYGGVSPPPQQNGGYGGRPNQGGNYYDDYRRTGNNTPQGYGMDRRSPRVPDVGMMDNRSPRIPDVGMMDNRTPRIPDVGVDSRSPRIPELASDNGAEYGVTGPGGPNRYASPAPYGGPSSRSPANGRPMNAMNSMNNRPPPQRQYSGSNSGYNNSQSNISINTTNNNNFPAEMPASPTLQNSGGFDFIGGQSSRPPARAQDSYGSNNNSQPLTSSASPPPLQQPQPERAGYPGYRAYRS